MNKHLGWERERRRPLFSPIYPRRFTRWPAKRHVMPSMPGVTLLTGCQRSTSHTDVETLVALPPAEQLSRACTRTRTLLHTSGTLYL